MRVAHLFRGTHDYIVELLNAQARVAEVHVLLAEADEFLASTLSSNITVHVTKMPRVRDVRNLSALLALRSLITRIQPDVLHMQSGIVWECALFLLGLPCPVVLTIHDVVNHPSWGGQRQAPNWAISFAIRSADALIAHGEVNQRLVVKRFGFPASRVHSVDHGVIARYGTGISRAVVPCNGGNVLLFGRIDKYKGVEYLISAETLLRELVPEISITIAGVAPKPEVYQTLVREDSHIKLDLVRQRDEDVTRLFRWADIVVLPYVEASQSGVLQLAMAFGVPPVVTAVGGLPDVVQQEITGIVVPPRNPEALAHALSRLLKDSNLRATIIAGIQKVRETRFSWEEITLKTMSVYRKTIKACEGGTKTLHKR